MSPRQASAPRYVSGLCAVSRLHDRCRGAYAGAVCGCPCHTTCQACGQPLPTAGSQLLTQLAAANPPCPLDDP